MTTYSDTPWDILDRVNARDDDEYIMSRGCHYDYVAQCWVDGHDHAHLQSDDGPLLFCGADAVTCRTHPDGSVYR